MNPPPLPAALVDRGCRRFYFWESSKFSDWNTSKLAVLFPWGVGGKSMASKTEDVRLAAALSGCLGSFEFVFDDDDVVQLLRIAIEHEGSQMAFSKRHGISRTYLNMVLNGKRPVGEAVAEALGLYRVYKAK